MSNCITVDGAVKFPAGLLDVVALGALLTKVSTMKESSETGNVFPEYHAWWFLLPDVGASLNVQINADGSVIWYPGVHCRSSHTWRDFQGTLNTFKLFASQPFNASLMMRDDDAPSDFGRMNIGWK